MRALNGLLMTICLAVMACIAASAHAQGAFGAGGPHMRASLLAESETPAAGETVTLAILMQPDKGWHGYWENPGDAGVGMILDWSLPDGVRVGALRYPPPQRLLIAGLMNHVYSHDYAVLVDVTLPAGLKQGATLAISARGDWLVCTEQVCVPEQGKIGTVLTIGDGAVDPAVRARFDAFRAALPRPLDRPARYSVDGHNITIAIPYPVDAPVAAPWFYALTRDRIVYAAPQSARRVGNALVIETKTSGSGQQDGSIEGVLSVTPSLALRISAAPGAVPSGGAPVSARHDGQGMGWTWPGVALALGGALAGGLILNIMPCVFPILSLKALGLARAGGDERAARREAVAYAGGVLLACLTLGALMLALRAAGAEVGWAFQLQKPGVIALLLALMLAITLNLAGVFDLAVVGVGQAQSAKGGALGAFWTGALAAFVATPCTGPFMGAAMGAALVLPWPLALLIFAGLALGLAAPFVAIAFIPALRARLPKPGRWMARFKHIMAVPMALTGAGAALAALAANRRAGIAAGRGADPGQPAFVWLAWESTARGQSDEPAGDRLGRPLAWRWRCNCGLTGESRSDGYAPRSEGRGF